MHDSLSNLQCSLVSSRNPQTGHSAGNRALKLALRFCQYSNWTCYCGFLLHLHKCGKAHIHPTVVCRSTVPGLTGTASVLLHFLVSVILLSATFLPILWHSEFSQCSIEWLPFLWCPWSFNIKQSADHTSLLMFVGLESTGGHSCSWSWWKSDRCMLLVCSGSFMCPQVSWYYSWWGPGELSCGAFSRGQYHWCGTMSCRQ